LSGLAKLVIASSVTPFTPHKRTRASSSRVTSATEFQRGHRERPAERSTTQLAVSSPPIKRVKAYRQAGLLNPLDRELRALGRQRSLVERFTTVRLARERRCDDRSVAVR
jgi:hypothetical protein